MRISRLLVIIIFVVTAYTHPPGHAQVTDCIDDDGDGWGYSSEKGATCKPVVGEILPQNPTFTYEGTTASIKVVMDTGRPMRVEWWNQKTDAVTVTRCEPSFNFGSRVPHEQTLGELEPGEKYAAIVYTSLIAGDSNQCDALPWQPAGEAVAFELGTGGVPVAVRATWPANPEAELVTGYEFRVRKPPATPGEIMWSGGGTDAVVRLNNIPATEGDEVCFTVRAVRGVDDEREESPFSDEACILVPKIVPPNPVALTKPGDADLQIVFETTP